MSIIRRAQPQQPDDIPEPAIQQWLVGAHPAQIELIDLQQRVGQALTALDAHLATSAWRPVFHDALLDIRQLLTANQVRNEEAR